MEIYAAKSDFTKIINKGSRFEAGYKFAFTNTDNEADYSTTIAEITTPDYDLSNRFLYKEWINAGYLNYTKSLGRFDFQLGLRLETTRLKGDQLGNIEKPESNFTRTYANLFPTFYTSWKMDSSANNVLIFSYGRRIDRPYFQDLNPFISPLDKFTFYAGNPDLLPTFSHNLSLSHSFKSIFTTTLDYSKTLDGINETLEIRDGIYYSRPGNISDAQVLSLSFELNLELRKWYSITSYLTYMYRSFESQLYTEILESSGTNYNVNLTNNFNFGKGWSADLVGFYTSDFIYAQLFIKGYGQLNAGVQKRLLNNSASIRLTVSDILYSRIGDGVINNLRLTDADWNSTFDSRAATLTFSWRFGNSSQKKQRHNSNGSSEEQNRVKS
ncbi:MAG: TonB-dependent receptor family protein [Saprospiraceae bacterium]|nr:TonB-dependent receptor family protein [Saprospiraceae bacterium]